MPPSELATTRTSPGADRRDEFGNLVRDQFDEGVPWTYSGPDDKIEVTRAALKGILKTCRPLTSPGSTLDKGELSYVILSDKQLWGELAGYNMVLARFQLHTAWQPGGPPTSGEVAFAVGRAKRPEIVTNAIGARFCGVSPAPHGQQWTHIPAPALAPVMVR